MTGAITDAYQAMDYFEEFFEQIKEEVIKDVSDKFKAVGMMEESIFQTLIKESILRQIV